MQNILILTYEADPHADSVERFLDTRNVNHFRVATEKLAEDYTLTLGSNSLYEISDGKKKISLDSSWNIWNRRVMNPNNKKGMPKSLSDIVVDESELTWDGLLNFHNGKVVNTPNNHLYANNKRGQLKFASDKIRTPDTLITNDPSRVEEFYEKHKGNICFKLQKGAIVDGKVIYTNKVTKKDIANIGLVSRHPCLFQEYIDKQFEVRVVATDRTVTGIAIDSQNSEISKIDFRRYDFDNVKYKHVDIQNDVKDFYI